LELTFLIGVGLFVVAAAFGIIRAALN